MQETIRENDEAERVSEDLVKKVKLDRRIKNRNFKGHTIRWDVGFSLQAQFPTRCIQRCPREPEEVPMWGPVECISFVR